MTIWRTRAPGLCVRPVIVAVRTVGQAVPAWAGRVRRRVDGGVACVVEVDLGDGGDEDDNDVVLVLVVILVTLRVGANLLYPHVHATIRSHELLAEGTTFLSPYQRPADSVLRISPRP